MTGAFEATGVTKWIGGVCEPLLAGFSGQLLVFIVVCTTTLCTQLTNNNACAATFAPIAYTLALANGTVDPQAGATRAEMAVMLQQFVGLMEQ